MLADKSTQQTLLIRTVLDSPGPDQHDRVCHLNIELQTVVTRIRELPGLSGFLLPPFFSDLQQAAREGPVIIVMRANMAMMLSLSQSTEIPSTYHYQSQRKVSENCRPSSTSRSSAFWIHFGGIGQTVSDGAELANTGQRVDGLAIFTHIEGQEASIARVTEELGKNEWVHLACHAIPDRKQPFESAFALHDGHFTIERIIRFGDEESPDEVIYLASAMQFAGFRSVIGTMWGVDDAQTNKITSVFYDNMLDEGGRLDYTRAALELNRTMKKLVDIPLEQNISVPS
ncbi:hypothetical protein J3R82DRAFT_7337 [Butyriboletus roseoflavus]|nr:hypothetical protein J3R82DRAFT_7337 [Butyriboletus roseoflavus]